MYDIQAIRTDPEAFDAAMARRGIFGAVDDILASDAEFREAIARVESIQARRNALAKQIAQMRRQGIATVSLEENASSLRADLDRAMENKAKKDWYQVVIQLQSFPNTLDPDVPDGSDEAANVVLKQSGEPRAFGFTPREHFDLGEALGLMDFGAAAKLAGSRFTVLRGPLARLERALGQFMIDLHTGQHGYEETAVPLLVGDRALYGTGQLPKFKNDQFQTIDHRWLIPTAEVPLTNLVGDEIMPESRLPIRVTALTECFRKEAGSAGRDTRGMLRQHQFRKVEMVSITHPDASDTEHERMTRCAEAVLDALGLAYRRVLLCSGDTGFSAVKTYDLEVWLPGQQAWREISSCSNTRAFQARRMNARFRGADGKPAGFVHTLNGSGVAVGRALIAVMETYQQADGSIEVPKVLHPYMGGITRIGPP